MLSEGSKHEDAWLEQTCTQEFHPQDRMDMSLSKYLYAVCKDFHESYAKGAAGSGMLGAFHRMRCPHLAVMTLPTPGPGNRFDISSHLAFCVIINFELYISYLYKTRAVSGAAAGDDFEGMKDGKLNRAIRLRMASNEFFACCIVRAQLEWFLIQPLGWLQSLKVDDGSNRRVLTMDRVPEHYELIIAAMRDVMENPDIARRKDYRIFGIQEYPQLGQLYEYRESRRLVSPDGTSHSLGDLVEERLYRRYSDEVEDLVRGRLEAFASHIIDSINRNASDMLPGGVNREMIDMGLDDFVGNVCDQIESNESQFGEFKYKDHRLQNANIKTVGGVTGLNRNKRIYDDMPIHDRIKKEFVPSYAKSERPRLYAEEEADLKRQRERQAEKIKDAEAATSMKMKEAAVKAHTYFNLQRLSSVEEMTFALSQRKPARANSNPEKHQIAFLTEQYKSYCFGCGYPYKPLSKKGNTVEDRFIGSLQDLKSRLCKIFEDIDQGKFVVPNEPASAAVSADEAIEAEQIEGFGTLSHIREIAAYQFMGPMPAEVERLKTLNSCLPGLKFP